LAHRLYWPFLEVDCYIPS